VLEVDVACELLVLSLLVLFELALHAVKVSKANAATVAVTKKLFFFNLYESFHLLFAILVHYNKLLLANKEEAEQFK
jgi:hypothetical protein